MKMIQREVKTYEDVYVSVDGREFTNKNDCEMWEKSYRGTLEASWKLIEKKEVFNGDYGIAYSSEDHECYVIKPKNLDEIVLINAYVKATTGDNRKLTTDHIGKLLLINFGYEHDWCDVDILEDVVAKITERVAKLEAEFNDKKEETECQELNK